MICVYSNKHKTFVNKSEMLTTLRELKLFVNKPLNNVTYTKTGGPADILAFPKTREEVAKIVAYCESNDLSWLVVGNASNLIVRDGGIRDVVIMLTEMKQITIVNEEIIVDAGAKLVDTTYEALAQNLTGFEFACGIPGSIGGAVYMNAGAYGGEIKDVLKSAEVLSANGTIRTMTNEELAFSYRHSILQEMHCVVLQATFELKKGDYKAIKARMDELTELRKLKQPLEYPSCGSVFKRPEGHFTGKLIQDAGLQGLKWGGAQISEKHAGFIVNIDHATATDYVELIAHIQTVVKEKFDVELQTEVRIIGE